MTQEITRRLALAGGAALLAAPSMAQAESDRALARRLRAHCEAMARAGDLSGAVLLAKEGRPLYRAAFGQRNRGDALPNRPDTKFNIASIGKMFTSLAIARFVQHGQLRFEDSLLAVWPDYANRAIAERVTIAQLLTHTAGLGNHAQALPLTEANARRTQTETLAEFVNQPAAAPPGSFSYSNDGYFVLGALIEKLSGESYFEHCHRTIFAPLGMTTTGAIAPSDIVGNVARAYVRDLERPGAWQDATIAHGLAGSAAGGAYSTVDDLLIFANALSANHLLNAELTAAWTQGRFDYPRGRYGYGTSEEIINGHCIIGHSGGHYGVAGELMLFDSGYTFIVLMNGEVDPFWDINNWIKRELVGENDTVRNYNFTRALIDELARDPAAGRAFYAARDPALRARQSVIDVYGFKLIHQGRTDAGFALLRFNVETFGDSSALWSMAEALFFANRRSEAMDAYRAYLAAEPGDADAQRRLAQLAR
ncbi:beta-lactamase [alpha proteobacterium U9-1i]|nr:beta-lactamase [alpha proteobacterium U9-1i]